MTKAMIFHILGLGIRLSFIFRLSSFRIPMPWQIGIDEAGYGPNLGPFVMCVTACRTPEPKMDLWHTMRAAVRRHEDEDDGRMLVADSKLVYSPAKGLRQ